MDIIGVVSSIVVVGLIRDAACLCLEPSYYLLVIFLPLHLSFLSPSLTMIRIINLPLMILEGCGWISGF